jgi:hypothetical protein
MSDDGFGAPLSTLDPLLVSIQRVVALAADDSKLRSLQDGALQLGRLVQSGKVPHPDAVDALCDVASANGLFRNHRRGDVEHVIGQGLKGIATLAPTRWEQDQGTTETWGEPDCSILDDRRGDLPDFPIDAFCAPTQKWLQLVAHGAGVTVAHVAIPLLGIVSSLIGTARRVAPSRSWSQPLTLWTAVVGYSGTGKTPGLEVITRALSNIERQPEYRKKVADQRRKHETAAEQAKAEHKKWKDEVQHAVENGEPVPEMPEAAQSLGEFIEPRVHLSDTSIERLAVLLQVRPRGMLLIRDELAGLFLNMGRYSRGQDDEFWLEAWNGRPFIVERQGRPAVHVSHLLVGITGGFQPDKLARSFKGDNDGKYARILFGWPDEPAFRELTNDVSEEEPDLINVLVRISTIVTEDENGMFVPRVIELSGDAVKEFEKFRRDVHLGKNLLSGREREWWAKGPANVLRIAGTLSYLGWSWEGGAEPTKIEVRAIKAAVRIWKDYFWPHSRAALRKAGLTDRHVDARDTLNWIRANDKRSVSREDVRRDALGQRLDANETEALLDTLEKAAWLRRITTPAGRRGGRPVHRWAVNPALFASSSPAAETAGTAETPATGQDDPGSRCLRSFRNTSGDENADVGAPSEDEDLVI